ncbi:hypothetical protein FB451DRAFT_1435104 [Mycena latifolia]|nr:hypothetical protein FB451DRAFT_1435104 [Mycena latifolia]
MSTATTKSPETSSTSRDLLEYFVENQSGDDLRRSLLRAIRESTPASMDRLDLLVAALKDVGLDVIDFPESTPTPEPAHLHCVRCHMDYEPLENTGGATGTGPCIIDHEEPTLQQGDRGKVYWYYPCCEIHQYGDSDKEWPEDSEDPDPAECFRGRHTTDWFQVDPNGIVCSEYDTCARYDCSTCGADYE